MLATMACVVFIASIMVFFSEELRKMVLGTLKNRRVQLLAPLFILSWLVIHFEWFILLQLVSLRIGLYYIVYGFSKLAIWTPGSNLILERILTLFIIPATLLGLIDLIVWWKKSEKSLRNMMLLINVFVWVVAAFLVMIRLSEYFF